MFSMLSVIMVLSIGLSSYKFKYDMILVLKYNFKYDLIVVLKVRALRAGLWEQLKATIKRNVLRKMRNKRHTMRVS